MAGKVLDSLWVRLGFQVDQQKLKAFQGQIEGIKHSVQGMAALFGIQVVRSIGRFVEHSIQGAAAINDFADVVGVAREEVDTLVRAGIEASTSADGMKASIRGVARATGEAAMGLGRGVAIFKALGMSAKDGSGKVRETVDVMGDLAERFSKMSAAQRVTVASRFGIADNLAATMASQGRAGFEAFVAQARGGGVLKEADFIAADRASKAFERWKNLTSDLVALIGIRLGPHVERLTASVQNWWHANREEVMDKVESGFATLAQVVGRLSGWLTRIVKVGRTFYDWLDKVGGATWLFYGGAFALVSVKLGGWLLGVAGSLGRLNRQMGRSAWQMGKVGFAAVVVYLALQDVFTFFSGGDSLIGRFVEFTEGLDEARGALLGLALMAATLLGPLAIGAVGLVAWSIAIKDLGDNWNVVKNWFVDGWASVTKAIDDAWFKVKEFAAWLLDSPIGKALRAVLVTLGATDADSRQFVDNVNREGNDRKSIQQNYDANHPITDPSRFAPSYYEGGQAVWRMRGGTNIRNDNQVHLLIEKMLTPDPARSAEVLRAGVNPALRDHQSPVRL